MHSKHIVCLLICILINLTMQCSNGAYPFENYLSVTTPYRIVANKSFEKIEFQRCVPKKIWMLVRHGTRNPSASDIEKIRSRLSKLKDFILQNKNLPNEFIKNRDLDLFRKWKIKLDTKDEKKLTHEGEEEMLLLAEKMQSRFPKLFSPVYSNTTYQFKHTNTQRTKKSAYYFAAGLFGKKTGKEVWFPEPLKKDPILRFYKLCSKWNSDVKKNPKSTEERRAFQQSPYMVNTTKKVNERLYSRNDLDTDDVVTMYSACAYETAWNKQSKSPWCSPFTVDDMKVLEYHSDLKYYWHDGYGYELSYKQACPLFKDLISFLTSEDQFPIVSAYFTHSGTLLKLLSHIGMYRETEHLTAENYLKMANRTWRTSLIDSFASNLAFVLFNCDNNEKKVLTLHQENIVRLPSCPDYDLCEIEKIEEFYNESINNCDLNAICRNSITQS